MVTSLEDLASKYNSDKAKLFLSWCSFYEQFLAKYRNQPGNILEIGIFNGASSAMWHEYLPSFSMYGLDISLTDSVQKLNIHKRLFEACQGDSLMRDIIAKEVPENFDIIIDDGSHDNSLTIKTFQLYWDLLKPGGIFIVEDLHCSFSECSSNSSRELLSDTPLFYFTSLIKQVNQNYSFMGLVPIHPVYRRDPDLLNADLFLRQNSTLLPISFSAITFGNGIVAIQKSTLN